MNSIQEISQSPAGPAPSAAPPFPSQGAAEHAAVLCFALGTLALTGTFGLRTALFHPEYAAAATQLGLLALQGGGELVLGFLLPWLLLLRLRREGLAKGLFIAAAVMVTLVKR
jgi:hypothetical protein